MSTGSSSAHSHDVYGPVRTKIAAEQRHECTKPHAKGSNWEAVGNWPPIDTEKMVVKQL